MHKLTSFIIAIVVASCSTTEKTKGNPTHTAQLFYKIDAQLGEGPVWNHETRELYWVDIEGKKFYILDPSTKNMRPFELPSKVGTVVPLNDKLAVVALEKGAYMIDLRTGVLSLIQSIELDNDETRLNDGKCDPAGRLWVGSMHIPETQAVGKLYQVTEDTLIERLPNVTISNGIVWTADQKTMYYIDTPTGKIRAFDFDVPTGDISNERTAVVISKDLGSPDGMAVDEEDKLWVGLWGGNAVARFDPETGELMQKVEVPAHNVTACAFGGANLDSLFITSARVDMTPEELEKYPNAGSIFVVVPGVKGVKSDFFKLISAE